MTSAATERPSSRDNDARKVRRAARKGNVDPKEAAEVLYGKPLEDWTDEELAHGRPKNSDGTFGGGLPKWLTPAVQEEATRRFREVIRTKANVTVLQAPEVIAKLMLNDDTDEDGRPVVAAGVKLDAAKYLMDHVIGKATQPVDVNANVKLQALLGVAVVQGGDEGDRPAVGFADRVDSEDAPDAGDDNG